MRILLVEPDVLLARTYQTALKQAGHEIVNRVTAQDAIHAANAHTPELVILELQLVSHSGIEFLYEFRSYNDWQTVPVLALSQVPPGEFINSWELLQRELGVKQYLYKPRTSLAQLIRIVESFSAAALPTGS